MSQWKKVKIGDIFSIEKGSLQSSKCTPGEYDFITAATDWKTHNSFDHECEAIVYAVAASGSLGRAHYVNGKFIASDLCFILTEKDKNQYPINFLFYQIVFEMLRDEIVSKTKTGTSKESINRGNFSNYEIPYFPIEFQLANYQKFVNAKNIIKNLLEESKKQKNYIKQLRQNILQEAIEGKLTADWRKSHPVIKGNPDYDAEALFEQIQKEHNKSIKVKSRSSNTIQDKLDDDFDLNIPQSWLFIRLSELGILERGKSKHRPRNDPSLFTDGKYPFVQTGDVAQSKYFGYEIQTPSKFYNDFGLAQSKMWCAGTLCITIAANIAETGFLTYDACFPDSIVGFTPFIEGVFSTFVRYYIDSIKLILEKYAPATAQKNINLGILETLKIPLPPLAEQNEIVNQVEKHLQTVSQLENQITEREQLTKQLMQSILKDAFEGESKNE